MNWNANCKPDIFLSLVPDNTIFWLAKSAHISTGTFHDDLEESIANISKAALAAKGGGGLYISTHDEWGVKKINKSELIYSWLLLWVE